MASFDDREVGLIGLGVMGSALAQNLRDRGQQVRVWNLEPAPQAEFLAKRTDIAGAASLPELVAALARPRKLLLMIQAGPPVDQVLEQLVPLLSPDDIVIDGGNSHFEDTRRRTQMLSEKGLNFVGMGVSGGEEGARHGPSLMPGGSRASWRLLEPMLTSIAAKTDSGACVTHIGPDGAGHFVKMVHNGIEYAEMQLLAEAFDLMSRTLRLPIPIIARTFERYNSGRLNGYLMEITAKLLHKQDDSGQPLIHQVLDVAGQKGTGRWTAQTALQLGVATPSIMAALEARALSALKSERLAAANQLGFRPASANTSGKNLAEAPSSAAEIESALSDLEQALFASKVCAHAQGFALIASGDKHYAWNIVAHEVARIWKGGCILRAGLLDQIMRAFATQPELNNLLLADDFGPELQEAQPGWRQTLSLAQSTGIPMPAMAASLGYFDSYRSACLPQNLTQAQRDAFGAHRYQRVDAPDAGFVHSEWLKP